MDANKRMRLEAKGWKAGTVAELLGMTPQEEVAMEIRYHERMASSVGVVKDSKESAE